MCWHAGSSTAERVGQGEDLQGAMHMAAMRQLIHLAVKDHGWHRVGQFLAGKVSWVPAGVCLPRVLAIACLSGHG